MLQEQINITHTLPVVYKASADVLNGVQLHVINFCYFSLFDDKVILKQMIKFLVDCLDNKILYNIKLAFRENE